MRVPSEQLSTIFRPTGNAWDVHLDEPGLHTIEFDLEQHILASAACAGPFKMASTRRDSYDLSSARHLMFMMMMMMMIHGAP